MKSKPLPSYLREAIPDDVLRVGGLAQDRPFNDLIKRVHVARRDLMMATRRDNLNRVELAPEEWVQVQRDDEFLACLKYAVNPPGNGTMTEALEQILGVPVFVRFPRQTKGEGLD